MPFIGHRYRRLRRTCHGCCRWLYRYRRSAAPRCPTTCTFQSRGDPSIIIGHRRDRRRFCRYHFLLHEHGGDNAQVVIHAQYAGQYANDQQFGVTALQRRVEQVVLGGEACHGWETRQGQHEDREQTRQARLAIPQAANLAVVTAAVIDALQHGDDAKCPQVHEGIA